MDRHAVATDESVDHESPLSPVYQQQQRATCDLLRRIPDDDPQRIGRLHTGPWSMSKLIARRFPGAEIAPLDVSRALVQAPASASSEFDLIHVHGDLDLLPLLRRLLPKLVKRLRVGGRLGAHFPNNLYEPNRELARMVAADGPWAKGLLPVAKTRPFNETMEGLFGLIEPICASVDIWETTYICRLGGVAEIVDFMKTTSLAPFLRPLDEGLRKAFLDRYAFELAEAYPARPDGSVLFRFPRIFVLAER